MAEFSLPANSRPVKGVTHAPPPGAGAVRTFRIYRYDPDTGQNPRIDTFVLDAKSIGPMVLDALIQIKSVVDSSLTFRR
jgi:succinate dehydrogenase / fumarate reductase iron-sulfur subunit